MSGFGGGILGTALTNAFAGKVAVGGDVSTNTAIFSGAANSLTLAQMLTAFGGVPVSAFGAVGNAVISASNSGNTLSNVLASGTNDAPAFQAAVNWLEANGGGILYCNADTYYLNGQVSISGMVTIVGQGWGEVYSFSGNNGTWFYWNNTGISPFLFSNSGASSPGPTGCAGIKGCGFIQQQNNPATGSSWSPIAYPAAIILSNNAETTLFERLMFWGINKAFSCTLSARHTLNYMMGQVFTNIITCDQEYDACRYFQWHFWPFWTQNTNVLAYQQANLDAIWLYRVDGPFMGQIFVFGNRSGLRISQSTSGSVNHLFCDTFYADGTKYPIWIDSSVTTNPAILSFKDVYGQSGVVGGTFITGSNTIHIDGWVNLQISNFCGLYCDGPVLDITNTINSSQVFIETFQAYNWDQSALSNPAINAANVTSGTSSHQIFISNQPNLANPGTAGNYKIINQSTNAIFQCPGYNASEYSATLTGATVAVGPQPWTFLNDTSSNSSISNLTLQFPQCPVDGMEVSFVANKPVQSVYFVVPSPSPAGVLFGSSAGATFGFGVGICIKFKYIGPSVVGFGTPVWILSGGFNQNYTGNLDIIGLFLYTSAPTTDPHVAGVVWRSGNQLMISTG